jgi:hypothetical protein
VNLAGITPTESLYLIVEIVPSGGGTYVSEVELQSDANASSVLLPIASVFEFH